jgi:hypothetical protein
MKFSELQNGDLFCFLNDWYTYKKVADTAAIPMCSRMNHVAEVRLETEVVGLEPSAYSRDREENMPDFEALTWELECQMAEMREMRRNEGFRT